MATLLLIRHGQASYGDTDYDRLSPTGQDQARALGHHLAAAKLDAVYAGPHRRQQQTIDLASAAAASAGSPLPATITLDALAEYPAFELLHQLAPRLIAEDAQFAMLRDAPTPHLLDAAFHTVLRKWALDEWIVEGIERIGAFVSRVRGGLDQVIRAARSRDRIACVTSAGPIGVALGLALQLPEPKMVRTSVVIRNASITELLFRTTNFDWQPDQLSLFSFNLTAHLPAELDTHR